MRLSCRTLILLVCALLAANATPAFANTEAYCRERFLVEPPRLERPPSAGPRQGENARALWELRQRARDAGPRAGGETSGLPELAIAPPSQPDPARAPGPNRDIYPETDPNPIKIVSETPVSTFSADVDTASYAVVRRHISVQNRLPPVDAVRPEELINAFEYGYPSPDSIDGAFAPSVVLFPAPWNPDRQLLRIGVKAYDVPEATRPPANLVFLLDTSGSMHAMDKLPLAKAAICMTVHELKPDDTVAMVVYAGAAGVVLEPTPVSEKGEIFKAMDALAAGGSTAGGQGIELAYALAEAHFREGAANRVLLATDGDFNVGINDPRQLRDYLARKRDTGIFLTVLGFGLGNYQDEMMQSLSQAGNGVAAYIDSIEEVQKVLVRGLTASIITVAKDVKFQVEFNPARVAEYRLIGYETRLLDRTEFDNDRVDAGDIGSGHAVTAIYELAMTGGPGLAAEPLRYDQPPASADAMDDELAFLRLRFKPADSGESRLIERPVTDDDQVDRLDAADSDTRFAAAVAWYAEALRNSPHLAADWTAISALAESAVGEDPFEERQAFIELLPQSARVAGNE